MPVFAIGRTHYFIYSPERHKRKTLPPFPIYIDSPMAIEATRIYRTNAELFDAEHWRWSSQVSWAVVWPVHGRV